MTVIRPTYYRWFFTLWLVAASAGATPYVPDVPNGECKDGWRRAGYSAEATDPKLRTLFTPGGTETYDQFYRRLDRSRCWKEWLVVIYMQADNDLSPFSYRDLWEMEAAGSFPSVDVVALQAPLDQAPRYLHIAKVKNQPDYQKDLAAFIKENHLEEVDEKDQEIAFLERQGPSLVKSPTLVTLPRTARPGSSETLDVFLRWAFEKYPSRRVMFVGWGHGKGFDVSPESIGNEPLPRDVTRGVPEDHPSKPMPVTEMVSAIKSNLDAFRRGNTIDIAGSDSCLNQQVEYGYEWRGIADYVFGSSTIVQRKGFNYRTLLNWFGKHPKEEEAIDLAREIPSLYGGSVTQGAGRKYSSYYDPYATMAVWTTGELRILKAALDDLGTVLTEWIHGSGDELEKLEHLRTIKKEIAKSLRLGGTSNDLHNVLQVLSGWAQDERDRAEDKAPWQRLLRELNSVESAINRTVLEKFIGKKYISRLTLTSKGVAIWIPDSDREYEKLFPKFRLSRFYREEAGAGGLSAWGRFIQTLYRL